MNLATKKLKASKHRIRLRDGRELQYHVPLEKLSRLDLREILPPNVLERPLEVEIGCGKGEFISRRAAEHPLRYFVGIDRRDDRFDLTERKLNRLAIGKNWTLLKEDARGFLEAGLPPIDILHIYHPDPWPKARHHKHRLFRSPDAREWVESIRPGGSLRIATDHRGYFEEILDIVASWELLDLEILFVKTASMGAPLTHFESIFLRKNEPVYKAVYRRR